MACQEHRADGGRYSVSTADPPWTMPQWEACVDTWMRAFLVSVDPRLTWVRDTEEAVAHWIESRGRDESVLETLAELTSEADRRHNDLEKGALVAAAMLAPKEWRMWALEGRLRQVWAAWLEASRVSGVRDTIEKALEDTKSEAGDHEAPQEHQDRDVGGSELGSAADEVRSTATPSEHTPGPTTMETRPTWRGRRAREERGRDNEGGSGGKHPRQGDLATKAQRGEAETMLPRQKARGGLTLRAQGGDHNGPSARPQRMGCNTET